MDLEHLQYPPYAAWEVTGACNHLCIHCYNYWRGGAPLCAGDAAEQMDAVADFLLSRKPADITITGGEPLLAFARWKDYVPRFRRAGISVRVNCNASLITDEIAAFCAAHQVRMMVSFPSADREVFARVAGAQASYDRVTAGIACAMRHGIAVSPNIVVSRLNLHTVYDTCRKLRDHFGVETVFISRVTRPINADDTFDELMLSGEEMDELFRLCLQVQQELGLTVRSCGGFPSCAFASHQSGDLLGKGCGAGTNGYVVDNRGDVRVCVRDDQVYGNIFRQDFCDIWAAMAPWRRGDFLPEECRECRVSSSCRGGCRISDKRSCGDYARPQGRFRRGQDQSLQRKALPPLG